MGQTATAERCPAASRYVMGGDWQHVRCPHCNRLLFRWRPEAATGAAIQVMCERPNCKRLVEVTLAR